MKHDDITDNWLGVVSLCLMIIFCAFTLVSCAPSDPDRLDRAEALRAVQNYHSCIENNRAHWDYRIPYPHWVEDARLRCFAEHIDEEYEEIKRD